MIIKKTFFKNSKMKSPKISFLILGLIFSIVGLCFLVYYLNVLSDCERITGTIVSTYQEGTVVEYIIDGQVFHQHLNIESDLYYVGKEIVLIYSYKTQMVYSNVTVFAFPGLFGGIGLISLLSFIIWNTKDNYRNKVLKNKDKYIRKVAKVVEVKMNKAISMNDEHPYQMICEVVYEGEKIKLKSQNIWEHVVYNDKHVVDVYFENKKKYVIDLSSYRKDEIYYEMGEF